MEDKDGHADTQDGVLKVQRGLSKRQLLTICVAQLNEAIQITMPYTLAVYMVRDFQADKNGGVIDEKEVGRLTGLLAACFCAAQFVSSYPLGLISDRVGRKPMLIMSCTSGCSVVLFGLSGSFLTATLIRLLGGLFNCTFVCLKSMIGESCDTQAQSRPLSILSLCWGLGTVIGPSLGGGLSNPCSTFNGNFPLCQPGQLFLERPFFLPCFLVGLVSLSAALCSMFFVEETLPSLAARQYEVLHGSEEEAKLAVSHLPELELSSIVTTDPFTPRSSDESDIEQTQSLVAPGTDSAAQLQRYDSPLIPSTVHEDDGTPTTVSQGRNHNSDSPGRNHNHSSPSSSLSTPKKAEWSESQVVNQLKKIEAEKELAVVWYKEPQILMVMAGYVMICLLYNLLDEITPIYSSADRSSGGLGFTTTQLAAPLVAGGVSIFIWNLFFYPWYQRTLGVKNGSRLAVLLSVPLAMLIGLPSLLSVGPVGLQIALASILFFKNICATNSFTAAVQMVNAVAPQKDIGSVNGASQGAASLVRAVGPALGGLMWSASISLSFKGHQLLGFFITGLGFIVPFLIFSSLKAPQLEKPVIKPDHIKPNHS